MLPEVTLTERENHPKPADKQKAVGWAQALLRRKDWVILDTETTGVQDTAEVIQIAIVSPEGDVLLDSFVRPLYRTHIPADATAVHGIEMSMLKRAPSMPELMPKLREILKDKLIVCYNSKFDERLIKQTIAKNGDGGAKFHMRFDCAMLQYARYVGEIPQGKSDYKWQKLPSATHTAVEDCLATLALIRQMAKHNAPATVPPPAGIAPSAAPQQGLGKLLRWILIPCTIVAVLVNLGIYMMNANREPSAPSANPAAATNNDAKAPESVAQTEPGETAAAKLSPGDVQAWVPKHFTNGVKITTVTTVRDAKSLDCSVFFSGPSAVLDQIFTQPREHVEVALVDEAGVKLGKVEFTTADLLKDRQGNLVFKGTMNCTTDDLAKAKGWEMVAHAVASATDTAGGGKLAVEQSEEMPPVAPPRPGSQLPDSSAFPAPRLAPPVAAPPTPRWNDAASQQSPVPAQMPSPEPFDAPPPAQTPSESSGANRLDRLERAIFSQTSPNLLVLQRLDRLEMEVFRQTFSTDSVAHRLNHLEKTLFGEN